jgi:hypothetical protein
MLINKKDAIDIVARHLCLSEGDRIHCKRCKLSDICEGVYVIEDLKLYKTSKKEKYAKSKRS